MPKPLRPSRITVPPHAHPHARLIFQLMREHRKTYDALEWESGVLRHTIKSWRNEKVPSLRSVEAALGAFGWGLAPIPPIESLSPEVREKLDEVGQHFISDQQTMAAAMAAILLSPPWQGEGPAPLVDYGRPKPQAIIRQQCAAALL